MTLVATSRSGGVPLIVGDFMITRGSDRRRARKKIARIRPNLAVGWTGSLVEAITVLEQMAAAITQIPSRDELKNWLEAFDSGVVTNRPLKLVGWIVDDNGATGFHWDSAAPVVQWGDQWNVGSGGQPYEVLSRAFMMSPDAMDEHQALEWLLALLSHLTADDMLARTAHAIGVGGGYEALFWSSANQQFEYLEDIVYFLAATKMDHAGRVLVPPQPIDAIRRYWIADECSFLAIGEGGGPTAGYEMYAMTAAGLRHSDQRILDLMVQEKEQGAMQMEARYYAGQIIFESPSAPPLAVPIVVCPWHGTPPLAQGHRGRLDLHLPDAEEIFRAARAN
jgi:ATP-dependent protease HslVU (ClpYQ) peptidase subunit